jgi:uncharacterized protein (UPF0276 family)
MNELGVGLVYFQGLEDFLALHSSLIDVVEIEPQTFWYDKDDGCNAFKYDAGVTDFLRTYNRPKLFHGVGYPVGGTFLPPDMHFNTLRKQAEELHPQWVSEHLSFNYIKEAGGIINAGFLLPPIQSNEGVKVAVANIRNYRSEMNRPFAFETGVNYLQPRKNEMPDGLFVRKVAEEADCHILLDLHNILTNQRNGRQSVKDFLEFIPFERVIELHVGGGMYYKDYYLDAHSGVSDAELFEILENVVCRLPNLKALMFEIEPDALNKLPGSEITGQLTKMQRIWEKRGNHYKKRETQSIPCFSQNFDESISVNEWENTLGGLILGRSQESKLSKELLKDGGIAIIKDLVFNFRGSVLISIMKLTTRLLRLSVGEERFNQYVVDFFDTTAPELLPVILAEQFAVYIVLKDLRVRYLEKILEYELFTIYTAIDKQARSVSFSFDPAPVMEALENLQLPAEQVIGKSVKLQIVYQQPEFTSEALSFSPVFHN